MTTRVLAVLTLVLGLSLSLAARQPAPVPVFTAAQAGAGQAAYQASCASCHLADLAGQNEAPQLAGTNFRRAWGARTTKDLIDVHGRDHAAGAAEPRRY